MGEVDPATVLTRTLRLRAEAAELRERALAAREAALEACDRAQRAGRTRHRRTAVAARERPVPCTVA